jgi:glutathione S-transferase
MLTLYDYLPSQNAWKIRQLLHHLQRPFRTEMISIFEGQGKSEEFRRINPTGTVPAVRLDDGRVLAESNAILFYLAEGSPYLPTDAFDRAKVLQWLSFEQERIESKIGALRHWTLTGKLARRPEQLVASYRAASQNSLRILDQELATRSFIAGERYGVADISVFAYASRAEEAGISLDEYPNFLRWVERVREQPGHLGEMYLYSVDPMSGGAL